MFWFRFSTLLQTIYRTPLSLIVTSRVFRMREKCNQWRPQLKGYIITINHVPNVSHIIYILPLVGLHIINFGMYKLYYLSKHIHLHTFYMYKYTVVKSFNWCINNNRLIFILINLESYLTTQSYCNYYRTGIDNSLKLISTCLSLITYFWNILLSLSLSHMHMFNDRICD